MLGWVFFLTVLSQQAGSCLCLPSGCFGVKLNCLHEVFSSVELPAGACSSLQPPKRAWSPLSPALCTPAPPSHARTSLGSRERAVLRLWQQEDTWDGTRIQVQLRQ